MVIITITITINVGEMYGLHCALRKRTSEMELDR